MKIEYPLGHSILLPLMLLPSLWGATWAPKWLELPEAVTVQEGQCMEVSCRLIYPVTWTSTSLNDVVWYRQWENKKHDVPVSVTKTDLKLADNSHDQFLLLLNPQNSSCSLIIRDLKKGNSGTYYFRLENKYNLHLPYQDEKLFLNVTALTHSLLILIPGTLESGIPRNLTCSVPWACDKWTAPIFSWRFSALTFHAVGTPFYSVFTFTPRPQDHGTQFTCQVLFPAVGVSVETSIQLNVSYAPQDTVISLFQGNSTAFKMVQNTSSLSILEGQALRLLCETNSNPPAKLSWFRGSPGMSDTSISNSSTLELLSVGDTEEEEFTCRAENSLGSQLVSLSLSVVWRADPWLSGVLGALVGAATMALLLCLCLGLLFRWKSYSRDPTKSTQGSASREQQCRFWRVTCGGPAAPPGDNLVSRVEPELHYAQINFPKTQPQRQEDDTDTEYTEIRIKE